MEYSCCMSYIIIILYEIYLKLKLCGVLSSFNKEIIPRFEIVIPQTRSDSEGQVSAQLRKHETPGVAWT